MRSHRAMFVAGAAFLAACSSAPPKDTLATLHKVAPDLQDVKVEGGLDTAMRCSGVGKIERGRDRHFEMPGLHGLVELFPLFFLIAEQCVVRRDGDARPWLRRRLHAGGIGNAPVRAKRIQAFLQRITTREREHGVHAIRRELTSRGRDVAAAPVDDCVGAELADQRDPLITGGRRQHTRSA